MATYRVRKGNHTWEGPIDSVLQMAARLEEPCIERIIEYLPKIDGVSKHTIREYNTIVNYLNAGGDCFREEHPTRQRAVNFLEECWRLETTNGF